MDLHELSQIKRKAHLYKLLERNQRDLFCAEPFAPEAPVGTEDGFDIIFVNADIPGADLMRIFPFFIKEDDLPLVIQQDLRVWNERGQEDRMRSAAFRTLNPADTQPDDAMWSFNGTKVITVDCQAGRMPT